MRFDEPIYGLTRFLFHIEENQFAVFGRIMHSPSLQAGSAGPAA
jgi:hypothetical protein